MKALRYLILAGIATAVAVGTGAGAASAAGTPTPKRTLAESQQHVDQVTQHITAHLVVLGPKVAANKRFTAAQKALINADIAALQAAAVTAQREIRADTTMAELQADRPLLAAVREKRLKLKADLAAARAH